MLETTYTLELEYKIFVFDILQNWKSYEGRIFAHK